MFCCVPAGTLSASVPIADVVKLASWRPCRVRPVLDVKHRTDDNGLMLWDAPSWQGDTLYPAVFSMLLNIIF